MNKTITMKELRKPALLTLVFLLLWMAFATGLTVHADELSETKASATEPETVLSEETEDEPKEEGYLAETTIVVKTISGAEVKLVPEEGSPDADRNTFTATGNPDEDILKISVNEPGNYKYRISVGPNTFLLEVCAYFDGPGDAGDAESFKVKTAIYNTNGTKTDTPTYYPPTDTPFGIADIEMTPFMAVLAVIGAFTIIGAAWIMRRKETV